jgi:hypothetical protein
MTTANRAAHPSSGEARGAARPDDLSRRAFVRGLTVASASPSLLLAACATTAPHGGRSASNPRIVERDLGGDALTSADERKPAAAR